MSIGSSVGGSSDTCIPGVSTFCPAWSRLGEPVTFGASFFGPAGNGGVPTGDVTFFDNATPIGTVALANGGANITVSNLAEGSHFITAQWPGDDTFLPPASPVGVPHLVRVTGPGWLPKGSPVQINTSPTAFGAEQVLANLTVANALGAGYLTANRCGDVARISTSNSNFATGTVAANLAVIPIDSALMCLLVSQDVQAIVDVQGYFGPTNGLTLQSAPPRRVLDTRAGALPSGNSIVRVATGVVGAQFVLANLTTTNATATGYITADKCSAMVAGLQSKSNGNFTAGSTTANLAVVPIDADGSFCIYTSEAAHVIADVQGSFVSGAGDKYTRSGPPGAPAPVRVLDTRTGTRPVADSVTKVSTNAPAGSSSVLVNLTTTDADGAGYITADRCSALANGPQTKSNGNYTAGSTTANLAVVPIDGDGSFCLYTSAGAELIADIQGSFGANGQNSFTPVTARRVYDSRLAL